MYTFHIAKPSKLEKFNITIGKTTIAAIIDSGSTLNLLDEQTYNKLNPKPLLRNSNIQVFAYQSDTKLSVLGSFNTNVTVHDKSTGTTFYVIKGQGENLLGKSTAENLDILRVGPPKITHQTANIQAKPVISSKNVPESTKEIIQNHADTFQGTGLLKDFQLKLHIDPSVTPVQQPIRRIPYHTRVKVEAELNRLLDADIIEPVSGPTSWLNPIVAVPKSDNTIRLCLDMRQANKAIQRERHVIPKIDDMLQDLHGARYFTKIDLREGYHQLMLHPESRPITAFATHKGIYQYKTTNLWSKFSF